MKIRWDNTTDAVAFTIPGAQKDGFGFTHLSIRISQKTGSASKPANLDQNLRIALKDGANNERAVRVAGLGSSFSRSATRYFQDKICIRHRTHTPKIVHDRMCGTGQG